MANIYHRKDGRWEVRIALGTDENGKRKYRSIYAKTREEAEYKLLLTQQEEPDSYHVTEMTVSELTAEWLHQAQIRLKESTIANYRMKTDKHILPVFGDMQCCQLTCRKVYDFIEKKLSEGLSPRYVSDMIVLMKSIFRYASREYHIRNVLDGITLPKCKKNETVLLSADQQKRLKAYVSANQSLAGLGVSLAMHTGTISETKNVSFTVEAKGNVTYQWYYRKGSSGSWIIVKNNGTSATYLTQGSKARNGWQFCCVVSDGTNRVTSDIANILFQA